MSNHDTCAHCGNTLNHGEQPCPYCGKHGRKIYKQFSEKMGISVDLAVTATSGKTNRSVVHCDTLNPTDTDKVENLIISFINNHCETQLKTYIETQLKTFSTSISHDDRIFFRGIDYHDKDKLDSQKIGPSPKASQGRYNVDGEHCLYLADNCNFIHHELNSDHIIVQKYKIHMSHYKIADVSSTNTTLHNNIALLFDMTERGKIASGYDIEKGLKNKNLSKYMISQMIASCFKNKYWDGLYIPGVHGENGTTYNNLIIFDSIVDQWEDWTEDSYFEIKKKFL